MQDQRTPSSPIALVAESAAEPMPGALKAKSNLETLAAQVLTQPPAAALPCNLADEWLDLISGDLEGALGEDAPQEIDANSLAAPLALVVHILSGQHGETGHAWSFEDLFSRLQDYRVEVALELLNRRTGVRTPPATLTTIFRQREVTIELAYLPEQAVK